MAVIGMVIHYLQDTVLIPGFEALFSPVLQWLLTLFDLAALNPTKQKKKPQKTTNQHLKRHTHTKLNNSEKKPH